MSAKSAPKTISASEFKATCLDLMDKVAAQGISFLITKHGRPVAKLTPSTEDVPELFGSDPIEFTGDVMKRIDVTWDAE